MAAPIRFSITQRLTALWATLVIAALVIFAALATAFDARSAQIALDQRLLADAAVATTRIDARTERVARIRPRASLGDAALVLYRDGRVRQILGEAPSPDVLARAGSIGLDLPMTLVGDEPYRVVVHRRGEGSPFRIAAFASEDPVNEEVARMQGTLLAAGFPLVAIAIVLGYLLARRSLAPIDRLTRTADDVARTRRFSTRFDVTSHDEIGRLGATFNAMLGNLEETYERERAFIGDVSHELRGPLTAIAGESQLALQSDGDATLHRGALARIEHQARALRTVIDDLLVLARADAGALGHGTCEIGEAVAEAASAIRAQYPTIVCTVKLQAEPATVAVPGPLALHLLGNLMRNAAEAARSHIEILVTSHGADAIVTIDDDGPGIPSNERERVFRRFERGAHARHIGTGLGLAIASAIASDAAGSIAIDDAPLGGARLTVRLPVRV